MAKRQTRKSVSLAAGVYAVVMEHAAARAVSASQLVEDALRAYGIPVPCGVHLDMSTRSTVRPAREVVPLSQITGDSFDRGETTYVTAATHAPPTRRPIPPPGTSCANCIDAKATQRGRVDVDGPEYWLCGECVLPDDRVECRPYVKRRLA